MIGPTFITQKVRLVLVVGKFVKESIFLLRLHISDSEFVFEIPVLNFLAYLVVLVFEVKERNL